MSAELQVKQVYDKTGVYKDGGGMERDSRGGHIPLASGPLKTI